MRRSEVAQADSAFNEELRDVLYSILCQKWQSYIVRQYEELGSLWKTNTNGTVKKFIH